MEGSPWGGSEELWSQAALLLARDGKEVCASVPHSDHPRPVLERLERVGVVVRARGSGPWLWERAWQNTARRPRSGRLLGNDVSWLLSKKADLVCISQGGITDGLDWMLFCGRHRIPYTPIVHSNAEWLWPDDAQAERMAEAYGKAALCCFVSQANRELLEDQIGRSLPNSALVRNPCNVSYAARPAWPDMSPHWRLACVARLDPVAKGQDLLLHALAAEKWRSRNLQVTFYGTGRCERSLRQLAQRLNLTNVDFRGYVPDVEQIWTENHALVIPSRYEGTPLALVEAMLCGRPAVITDVAGNAELVEHGLSGFVACAPTAPLLDKALEEAWQRRDEWREMGRRARDRVEALVPADPVRQFCDRLIGLQ
jgi:glycosyltransferase involved in cell wall biosynthesis